MLQTVKTVRFLAHPIVSYTRFSFVAANDFVMLRCYAALCV